jgi:hypothetical protein
VRTPIGRTLVAVFCTAVALGIASGFAPSAQEPPSKASPPPTTAVDAPGVRFGFEPDYESVKKLIAERYAWFPREGVPGTQAVLTVIINSRGEIERSSLKDGRNVPMSFARFPDFMAPQFPDVMSWNFEDFKRGSTRTYHALGPDPVWLVVLERKQK